MLFKHCSCIYLRDDIRRRVGKRTGFCFGLYKSKLQNHIYFKDLSKNQKLKKHKNNENFHKVHLFE